MESVHVHVHQVDRGLNLVHVLAASTRRTADAGTRSRVAELLLVCLHHWFCSKEWNQRMCIRSAAVSTFFTFWRPAPDALEAREQTAEVLLVSASLVV
jgi:hypothetical protein